MSLGGVFEPGKLSWEHYKEFPIEQKAVKIAGEIIPLHIVQLGQKLGITKYFVGVDMPQRGLNLSGEWLDRVRDFYKAKGFSPRQTEQLSDMFLRDEIEKLKNLTPQEKADIAKSVKEGKSAVFIHPRVKGRGTAIHETMHTLIDRELEGDLTGRVDLKEVEQLVYDSKESKEHDVAELAENLNWITRKHEFYTETMTQYFMGNLRAGTRTFRLAEAILRHSQDPLVRDLIGASLGTVISFGLMKKLQKKAD